MRLSSRRGWRRRICRCKAVRGQITFVKSTPASEKLKCNLCYGGYFSPAKRGEHTLGATFQRWLDHDQIIGDDDYDNIEKLVRVAPELADGLEIVGQRAAVRTTSPDHFPVIGHLRDNIYVSTGHGSHGIMSSIAAAHILTNMILERPLPFSAQDDSEDKSQSIQFLKWIPDRKSRDALKCYSTSVRDDGEGYCPAATFALRTMLMNSARWPNSSVPLASFAILITSS
jgi:glycine/D-amino acid oxidase-like deaminating enzyme